ncbi:MAG TPA: M20/M25/M40 family metallo-hydrolase [Thermoanaerobaculia bacterium]|nr:M20/M25/M40 family metallo-hydrolase [Thermoanaerobaculia bacterium]
MARAAHGQRFSRVERRRRTSARIALYGSLAVTGAVAVLLAFFLVPRVERDGTMAWSAERYALLPEVQMLREYIAIDTTPQGSELAGALWLADRLAELGLVPVVERVGDDANVWTVIEGRSHEAVVLHHHVDVEAVLRPEAWSHPPFDGVIDGPWLYGRGAFDMKSVAVAQLMALRRLVWSGERPERSVIFLATTGEEVGSHLGMRFFLATHPELVRRFAVVLTEGGAVEGRRPGEAKYWGTEFAQKRLVRVTLCSGTREPLAALEQDILDNARLYRGEPKLVPETERFLRSYAPTRDARRLRELLTHPRTLLLDRPTFDDLSAYLRGFFQNVLLPQGLHPVAGGGWELRLNLLLLPGEDTGRALDELLPPWTRFALPEIVVEESPPGTSSPLDHWAFQEIDRLMEERYPDVVHGPLMLPSTITDARFLRHHGITAYGFSPFNVLTPEVLQMSQYGTLNERISLTGFEEGVRLYEALLLRLAGADDS